ncbi:MAG: amidohydrolase family protein [Solirubrobacteraceae bacterium]|nr:amidohydrolase family protein [Solirubrobacteraceae bacterium]
MTGLVTRRELLVAGAAAAVATRSGMAWAGAPVPRTVDVHAHAVLPAFEAVFARRGSRLVGGVPAPAWSPEGALARMDAQGVGAQVLSVPEPSLTLVGRRERATLARLCNEQLAAVVGAHPGRFGGWGVLPMHDPVAALRELARVRRLGLDGVVLPTSVDGVYLGDPRLDPVLHALDRVAMPVLVHATPLPDHDRPEQVGLPDALLEFPFEIVRAATAMMYASTLTRFRRLRPILADGGGAVPYLSHRTSLFGLETGLSNFFQRRVSLPPGLDLARVLSWLRFDTAGASMPAQIRSMRELVPVGQILLGTDWPMTPSVAAGGPPQPELARSLSPEAQSLVRGESARALLPGLAGRMA